MRKLLVAFVALAVILASGAGIAAWRIRAWVTRPLGVAATVTVTVKRGATLRTTLAELEAQGVVPNARWLYLWARTHHATSLRAGEYEAEPADSPASLLDKLVSGKVKTEQLVIPPGHNRWMVRGELEAQRWMSGADFDRLCNDAAFLARNDIPGPTCEGYLFPETYTLARGLAPEAVLAAMFAMYRRVEAEVTAGGRGPLGLEDRKLTTLASIVEKETGAPEERPHIACVFYNRLQAKPPWKLETDPTVIYAATLTDPAFDGNLKREHLHGLDNPYNTYRVLGLPPGPIANPGRAALEAVVHPSACSDFFFVSTNNGQHVFCSTLGCHTKAVEAWQVQYFRKKAGTTP